LKQNFCENFRQQLLIFANLSLLRKNEKKIVFRFNSSYVISQFLKHFLTLFHVLKSAMAAFSAFESFLAMIDILRSPAV
jgi:hypothetical protein